MPRLAERVEGHDILALADDLGVGDALAIFDAPYDEDGAVRERDGGVVGAPDVIAAVGVTPPLVVYDVFL